ncbi:hypothetical protein ACFOWU_03930 [Epilithonimonas zeae]|uniref:Uncharacterized protein n=1 Tax=Epilithonimonas zeae TaxID=1416779 RepID=A0A1N6ESZ3_9FLAO|nr:hypothetical protein [Epilithonimonas zeae]SIN86120.1 hypothetical protein SAMN05444409_0832 [Epilithonimonas zeae]
MRVLYVILFILFLQACTTKKYTKAHLLPEDIKSATEEIYDTSNNQKKLLHKKELTFTKNGRIKYSKTFDSNGNLLQETEKKLWFTVERYPDKDSYYCKTRWKPNQRERISCYTKKQYKQNESIYHYNKNGSIDKIADNFETFNTRQFHYSNNELYKIVITGKDNKPIDELSISCIEKDKKGNCLKQTKISNKTGKNQEILIFPKYD